MVVSEKYFHTYEVINNIIPNVEKAFIMLIGCPGSGKSTFAKHLKELYPEEVVIINPSDVRQELFGDRYDQSNNYEVYSKVYEKIDSTLSSGHSVVYDTTNTVVKFREKALNASNKPGVTRIGIIFDTSIAGCFRRNERKTVPVDTRIIEKTYFSSIIKKPALHEGFDILIQLKVDD